MKILKNENVVVSLLMIAFAAPCVLLSSIADDEVFRDLLINLAASFVAVIPTFLFVNYIFSRKWLAANKASMEAVKELVDMHLKETVLLWGYMMGAGEPDQLKRSLSNKKRKKYMNVVKGRLIENDESDITKNFGEDAWITLQDMLPRLEKTVPTFFNLHGNSLSPEFQGPLLRLQMALDKLIYAFNCNPNAFVGSPIDYKRGFISLEAAKENKDALEANISEALYNYLNELRLLFESKKLK